jgi:hypothetical protein
LLSCQVGRAGEIGLFGEDSDMIQDNPQPPHALYVQWGRFKAGAFGVPAIAALILLAVAALWLMRF